MSKTEALNLADAIDPLTRKRVPDHLTVAAAAAALRALAQQPAPARVPPGWWLRSRVLDLLHLLQFSSISTTTGGDDLQAKRLIAELKEALNPTTPEEVARQHWQWAMGVPDAAPTAQQEPKP